MDDERTINKALLRYRIISPILAADPPRGQKYKMIEELAARQWVLEEGKLMSPQPETIRYWLACTEPADSRRSRTSPARMPVSLVVSARL